MGGGESFATSLSKSGLALSFVALAPKLDDRRSVGAWGTVCMASSHPERRQSRVAGMLASDG
jgi:hypothetical protein